MANFFDPFLSSAQMPPRRVELPKPPEMGPKETIFGWDMSNQVGACGIGNLHSFKRYDLSKMVALEAKNYKEYYSDQSKKIHEMSGGCGFMSAAFIDTPECKEMYKLLKDKFPILYTSEIRFNTNSGNNFFFCIYDTGEKVVPEKFQDQEGSGFSNGLEW